MNAYGEFPVSVKISRCANGETREATLRIGDDVYGAASIFRTPEEGESEAGFRARCFRDLIKALDGPKRAD